MEQEPHSHLPEKKLTKVEMDEIFSRISADIQAKYLCMIRTPSSTPHISC